MTETKERNIYLDLVKLFAAYCVIFIHVNSKVPTPKETSFLLSSILATVRFAVPFFFIVSGYFSYRIDAAKIKKRLKTTGITLIVASLVYFLCNCFIQKCILHLSLKKYLAATFTYKSLADFVFLENNPFAAHLWYVAAIFVIYLALYLFTALQKNPQKPRYRTLYICAAALFVLFNFVNFNLVAINHGLSYISYRNGMIFGFPFFTLGLFLNQYRKRIATRLNPTTLKLIIAIAVCILLSGVQVKAYGKPTECPPLIGVAAALIFILCNRAPIPTKLSKLPIFQKGLIDKLYLHIYLWHLAVLLVGLALAKNNQTFAEITKHRVPFFIFTALSATILSCAITAVTYIIRQRKTKRLQHGNH